MRRNVFSIAVTVVVMSTFLLGFSAVEKEIQARMKERLPVITELKVQALVGEDNQGFLRYLKGKKPHKEVVDAENRDRLTVYEIIAEKRQTSPKQVGSQRAAQIAGQAPSGTWVQDSEGKWRQAR